MFAIPQFRFALRRWRKPVFNTVFVLLAIESLLVVPALALTGIADPDTYRDKLWHDGFMNGFNSDPSTILYAYANYQPVNIPLVWSPSITKYNLVIVVLSMFLLIVESCMIFVHVLWPIVFLVVSLVKAGLFAYSIYGQTAPDTIDPQQQNHGPPWYITRSCSVSYYKSDVGYCQQAKSLFFVTVLMMSLFGIYCILSIQAMLFAPEVDPDDELRSPNGKEAEDERQWEMVRIPDTPGTVGGLKSPVTPRTRAFNDLEGGAGPGPGSGLPLREKYAPFVYGGYNAH